MTKDITEEIFQLAYSSGFSLVGIAPAKIPAEDKSNINLWIEKKFFGEMEWFPKNNHIRLNFENLGFIPESTIALGSSYYTKKYDTIFQNFKPKISRYATGKDYHTVLKKMAEPLLNFLKSNFPSNRFRMGVDSLPISEKTIAKEAGLGWRGKNTNLINPEIGSFFFLSVILTDLIISHNAQKIPDRCGKCRLCIDACPTNALFEDYKIDATKCISYLTIESKNSILQNPLNQKTGSWIFGCDICQDVCPWNNKKTNLFRMETKVSEFSPCDAIKTLTEKGTIETHLEKFQSLQKESAMSRISFEKWKENIQNFLNNQT